MAVKDTTPIVIDTSVLLNFVNVGCAKLLGCFGTTIVLIDQVKRPKQWAS